MKRNTLIITGIAILISIVAFSAFAHDSEWGRGYGHMMGHDSWGPGWHHEGWRGTDYGYRMDGLSDDQIHKLGKEQELFFKATEDLRQDIYAKELELRSEFDKKNPDTMKATKLQKEISDLEAKIDQERINHIIRMRKINPNVERMPMGRGEMGYGRFGGGYCWR